MKTDIASMKYKTIFNLKIVQQVIDEERLQENCLRVGTQLLEDLSRINSKLIGDVRGKGLMIGLELVEEDGRDPLGAERMGR